MKLHFKYRNLPQQNNFTAHYATYYLFIHNASPFHQPYAESFKIPMTHREEGGRFPLQPDVRMEAEWSNNFNESSAYTDT